MTRIDFYTTEKSRLQIACKLVVKALSQKLKVTIFAPEDAVARSLDKLLWTDQATAFVPHCFSKDPLAAETPVIIASMLDNSGPDELLLNLADACPTAFGRYRRLIEIVSLEDGNQDSARLRWRHYKERGYDINHVDLRKA